MNGMHLTKEEVRFFKENGYLHVRGLFTEEEVKHFKEGCKRNAPGDSVCRSEFGHVMLSEKVITIIKDLIGEPVVYLGLSLTRTNDFPKPFGSRFFHTDTMGDDGNYSIEYPIINTGIYLEDHTHFSNALKIMPRSHTRACITSKTITEALKHIAKCLMAGNFSGAWSILNLHASVNVPSMPGDLIIWYVRTHHSGYGVRPRFFPNCSLPPVIENWIPSFLRLPDNPERDVMLSIYTTPSKYLEKYIQLQIPKGYRREHYLNNQCLESDEIQKLAKELNVSIRNDGYHYALDPKSTFAKAGEYS